MSATAGVNGASAYDQISPPGQVSMLPHVKGK